MNRLHRVISGGQTGVDRAGLDAAMEAGLPVGGYVPKGRLAEDGQVPDRYPLIELKSKDYRVRTKRNVLESHGTLILNIGKLTGGTKLTAKHASENDMPLLIVQLDEAHAAEDVLNWINEHQVKVLNVAGPRESGCPGIHEQAKAFLAEVFSCAGG